MKNIYLSLLILLSLYGGSVIAQTTRSGEAFGNTLNVGLGIGYYGYIGHTSPVISFNYEIDVVRNFTLAPFVTVFSYRNYYRYTNQNYYYRQTVIPVGVKGTYYFDMLLNAGSRWDFYVAGSVGLAIRTTRWDNGFDGNQYYERSASGLYLDAHIGVEYHAGDRVGLFLDLSSGISTLGLAFHL